MAPERTQEALAECVERIGGICRRFRIDSLREQLSACEDLLREGGVVDVAVLGQFKAGKSTFLNGLFGRPIVPVDVLPSTAVVTRIGYGPRERALVHGLTGEAFEIPLAGLAGIVTERGNPGNAKRVSRVDVELPDLAAYQGIRFVDTPGLGSVFAHNTRASKDWMPRVGAALVAVSVHHPLSEDDLLLLSEVSAHTPEAAILMTKADLVSRDELSSVIDFTKREAQTRTGKAWAVLPVSDRPGFEAMRADAEAFVRERIAARRANAHGEIARHKILGLATRCREYLRVALCAAESAEASVEALRTALARERKTLGAVSGEIRAHCRTLKAEARTAADARFQAYRAVVAERLAEDLRASMPGWRGNLAHRSRMFEAWLAERMMEEMGSVSLQGEGHLAGFLFKAEASASRTVRAFQDRLAVEIDRALGVRPAGALFEARVEEPSHPDVRLSPTFDTHFELLWFLIPMPVFGGLVRRHFLRRLPWEAEKNLSRVASQWADAVGAAIDGIASDAGRFLETELDTIESLVAGWGGSAASAEEIREALAGLASVEYALS
jgi:GTP-binding protein EngB required for normal cell division